jgi:hypothetical protein
LQNRRKKPLWSRRLSPRQLMYQSSRLLFWFMLLTESRPRGIRFQPLPSPLPRLLPRLLPSLQPNPLRSSPLLLSHLHLNRF